MKNIIKTKTKPILRSTPGLIKRLMGIMLGILGIIVFTIVAFTTDKTTSYNETHKRITKICRDFREPSAEEKYLEQAKIYKCLIASSGEIDELFCKELEKKIEMAKEAADIYLCPIKEISDNTPPWWLALVGILFGCIGYSLVMVGRSERWPTYDSLDKVYKDLFESSRDLVLYLRSFDDDGSQIHVVPAPNSNTRFGTDEEDLCEQLFRIGLVFAIGRPNEHLPEIGSYRLYANDADWKNVVTALIGRARLIVLRTGFSSGLIWELEAIIEAEKLSDTMFVLHSDDMRKNLPIFEYISKTLGIVVWPPSPPKGKKLAILILPNNHPVWIWRDSSESLTNVTSLALDELKLLNTHSEFVIPKTRRFEVQIGKLFLLSQFVFAVSPILFIIIIFIYGLFGSEFNWWWSVMEFILGLWGVSIVIFFILYFAGGSDPDIH